MGRRWARRDGAAFELRRDAPQLAWELAFAALVAWTAWPLWQVAFLPIQDLPQHLAAVRVLHSYDDPALNLTRYFEIELFRTQYLTYYLAADLLAYLLDVEMASRLLVSATVIATPYALRSLQRALGSDERYALLALPLTYNAHLILGFVNFLAAIPLMFWGMALAVRLRGAWRLRRALGLAVLCVLTFYTHVVPFGLLGLAAAVVAVGGSFRESLRRLLPLLPAAGAALLWSMYSPAGQATLSATIDEADGAGRRPSFQPWLTAWKEAPGWLTDVFAGELDGKLLVGWAVLALAILALAASRPEPRRAPGVAAETPAEALHLRARVTWLAPLAALAYFVLPTSYDWIWPIAPRFPLLAALLVIPILPRLPRAPGWLATGLAAGLALAHVHTASEAFVGFDREVGELDAALAEIPPGQRVAGLIWARGSRHVRFSPFLHAVAYYQARKGGAVMFTFADFPQSPFRFRPDDRPPRVPPRWEWKPEQVDPGRDLAWYDYVLVRGGPGRIAKQRERFEPVYRAGRWSVWRQRQPVSRSLNN